MQNIEIKVKGGGVAIVICIFKWRGQWKIRSSLHKQNKSKSLPVDQIVLHTS